MPDRGSIFSYPEGGHIWPRGRFWPMDREGRILNDGAPEKIDPIFGIAIRQTLSALHRNLKSSLHSAYVTGAVARGMACPGASDLETRAVLKPGAGYPSGHVGWLEIASGAATAGQMAARRVDLRTHHWEEIFPDTDRFSWPAFDIATTGVCLWGSDIIEELPLYAPCPAIANRDIIEIEGVLKDIDTTLINTVPPVRVRDLCRRAAEAVLLTAGAFVLEEEMVHTRDLDLARDLFLLHFPEYRKDMTEAYRLARRPSHDPSQTARFFRRVRAWLIPMANRWLDRHNPHRADALSVR